MADRRSGKVVVAGLALAMAGAWLRPSGSQEAATPGPAPAPATMPLWPAAGPGEPPAPASTLTLFRPPAGKASGAAVVVCPGGGYSGLADHEAAPVARWLNSLGIAAVVLRYRLGPDNHHPAMLQDASRAIQAVRANAQPWGIDPDRVGIIGFSAGGHLASSAGTHFSPGDPASADPVGRFSSRPDRMMLIYPVISMDDAYTHAGSKRNLLGDAPDPAAVKLMSSELQVTPQTPPTFLVHTDVDTVVVPENSLLFAMSLRKNKVPVELHLFQEGPHGVGLGRDGLAVSEWPQLCARWLDVQGFLKKKP